MRKLVASIGLGLAAVGLVACASGVPTDEPYDEPSSQPSETARELPSGWQQVNIKTSDGRTVECVAYYPASGAVSISCDWGHAI